MNRSTAALSLILAAGLALPTVAEAHGSRGGRMDGFHGGGVASAPGFAAVPRAARSFRHTVVPRSGVVFLAPARRVPARSFFAPGIPLFLGSPIPPLVGKPIPPPAGAPVSPIAGAAVPIAVAPAPQIWRWDGDAWKLETGPR